MGVSGLLWALVHAAPLPAQVGVTPQSQASPSVQPPVSARGRLPVTGCAGQPIHRIVVLPQPPYVERMPAQLDVLRQTALAMHSTTRERIVRGFLLLREGEPCNQIRRAESERILRAQPYIVDARVRVYDDGTGGVQLEVETRDELSLIVDPVVTTKAPMLRALRVGDNNLWGLGRALTVQWRDGRGTPDVLGVQFTDYQFAGERNELRLRAVRREHGQELRAEIARPFYTDFQSWAYIGSLAGTRDFTFLLRPSGEPAALTVAQRSLMFGAVGHAGSVGRLRLFGLSLTGTSLRVDSARMRVTPIGVVPDSGVPIGRTFRGAQVVRANALLGLRFLRFVPVEGFDALTGTQDVRVGMQLGVVVGQSLPLVRSLDRDRFVATSLYAGVGGQKSFAGLQLSGEARQDQRSHAWDNLLMTGRLAWYFRPAVRQLTTVAAEWSGARDVRMPLQVSLADLVGGLHAHAQSSTPGGERLVLRAEQRLVIPSRLNVADIGLAAFAEAGRLWAERSVPYAQDTPWRGAVGVSFLAAIPPRSRRLWRVDLAVPAGSDPRRRVEVRFSSDDRTRVFWREPNDMLAARDRTVPASLFSWP